MKTLLILLIAFTLHASDYVLISGFAWHEESKNVKGREFDKVIEGIGYHHKFKYVSASTLLYNDSNSNPNISATLGATYELFNGVSVGAEAGVAYQTVIYKIGDNKKEFNPVAFPKIEILYDRLMMNLIYVPEINYNGLNTPSVVYVNFGIRI